MKKAIFAQYQHKIKNIPRKFWIIGGVLVSLILAYGLIFFIPRSLVFSYAGESCTEQLVLFPSVQSPKSKQFTISTKNELKIGSFAYAATNVCATPKEAPKEGEYLASIGLFGGWFMPKLFNIEVPTPPVVRTDEFVGKTISTALPFEVPLSSIDAVHRYELTIADKATNCEVDNSKLLCEVAELGLTPGAEYKASLLRTFNGTNKTKLVEGAIETLIPIKLQEASVTDAATVYDKRRDFTFKFDKPVSEAEVILVQKSESELPVDIETRFDKETLTVSTTDDLPRKQAFTLTLKQVVADNGSALETPITTNFSTSGGPKPSTVSVGSSGVAQNARIVIAFDQPIHSDVKISDYISVTGVSGSPVKVSDTEVAVSIQAGLCQGFSLVLKEGMASGSNDEKSEAWKFDSRTICGTSAVIGYSVQGRPIIAYYFGNGSKTILFTGGIHGEERSAQQTMQAWADYLMVNAYKIPADKRVVVVPNLNPDGIARGVRNNVNNVNLGRNYPTANWKASIDTASGILPTGGGTEAGSEPETKAIMALTSQLRPRLEISFHAQGRLVGANKVGDSVAIGDMYAKTVGYGTMFYNAEEVMGYSITGEYEEWMGEQFGTPAILIELPSRQGSYLNSQLNALMKMLAV